MKSYGINTEDILKNKIQFNMTLNNKTAQKVKSHILQLPRKPRD